MSDFDEQSELKTTCAGKISWSDWSIAKVVLNIAPALLPTGGKGAITGVLPCSVQRLIQFSIKVLVTNMWVGLFLEKIQTKEKEYEKRNVW